MEIAIILCIFYQIYAGFNRVMGKDKRTVPVLYEGEAAGTNDFNKKVEMIAEIKKYYFFKQKIVIINQKMKPKMALIYITIRFI
ncbi:TPA: hypothetical protein ACIRQ5_003616 [Yersinia enterocolitica]